MTDPDRLAGALTELAETASQYLRHRMTTESTLLRLPVDLIAFSVRVSNDLANAHIRTVGDLVEWTPLELLERRNLGRKSLQEIERVLERMGLRLKNAKP